MRIGIDFDNTIAGYDAVFHEAAREHGFICDPAMNTKPAVRAAVRALEGGEEKWMALQGEVYGKRMRRAMLLPGVDLFLRGCKAAGIQVHIVSHKTEYGHFDPDRVNLRTAARSWMADQGFFEADGFGLRIEDVIFENTRPQKVARIAALGCSHFIDDLEEVFLEPGFPSDVQGILFDPARSSHAATKTTVCHSWHEIRELLLAPYG